MIIYEPRTSAPSKTSPYWISCDPGYNGYNDCIIVNESTGEVLPNCVGYAYGRFMEIGKQTTCNLSTGNAENWWAKNDGYERGQEPRLGAVICWRKGKAGDSSDGCGHVAVVEQIYENGDILVSQSGWKSTRFWTSRITKASGYSNGANYYFQGFIYNPWLKELPESKEDRSKDQLRVDIDYLRVRTAPSLSAESLGYAAIGFYDVLERKEADGYAWCKVGDYWMAETDGSHFIPKEDEEVEKLRKEVERLRSVLAGIELECANALDER